MSKPVRFDTLDINDYDLSTHTGDYSAWFPDIYIMPTFQPSAIEREGDWPIITRFRRNVRTVTLTVSIRNSASVSSLRAALLTAFDTSRVLKPFVISDNDDNNERYVMASARSVDGDATGMVFGITLDISEDAYWRSVTPSTDTWNITASGQTNLVVNGGDLDSYPTITITPTVQKTAASWKYRWPMIVKWNSPNTATQYPIRMRFDTETPINESKIATTANLGVIVDGVEVSRYYSDTIPVGSEGGWDDQFTNIWINLDFSPSAESLFADSISDLDTPTEITLQTDTSAFPDSGFLLFEDPSGDAEVFSYTAKDNISRTFHGVTRAVHGTVPHSWNDTAEVFWMQHQVFIVYGDRTAITPDETQKPVIHLAESSNLFWYFSQFGDDDGQRSGRWETIIEQGSADFHTDAEGNNANPWSSMGINSVGASSIARWQLHQPVGITEYEVLLGRHWHESGSGGSANIFYSLNGSNFISNEASIPFPDDLFTWEIWARDPVELDTTYYYLALRAIATVNRMIEIAEITVTLDSDQIPDAYALVDPEEVVEYELENYDMVATLENTTTGESLEIAASFLQLDESFIIDTENWLIYSENDNINRFANVSRNSNRQTLLKLTPGNNTFRYTETGVAGVTIEFEYKDRTYV